MGALNIKDPEVARKARRLAELTHTSITAAVSQALDVSLKSAERKSAFDRETRERRVDEAIRRFQESIPPDAPSYEEVMADMYDENGLPK